jgi:hypothetical protein
MLSLTAQIQRIGYGHPLLHERAAIVAYTIGVLLTFLVVTPHGVSSTSQRHPQPPDSWEADGEDCSRLGSLGLGVS